MFTAKPGAAAAPPPRVPTGTVIFGQKPPEQSAPKAATTQMFGAVKPPAPKAATTQMFGAVKPEAAQQPAAKPATTQMFGAVKPEAPQPPRTSTGEQRSSTQTFGAVKPEAAQPPRTSTGEQRSSTQMFGAVKPDAAQPPRSSTGEQRSSTQMFGAVKPEAAQPPRTSTSEQRSSTQMFGAVKPPEQRSSTQMFGAVSAEPPPSEGVTEDSDTLDPDAPQPPDRRSSTMIFGNPFAEPQPPPAEPPASEHSEEEEPKWLGNTQLFGKAPRVPMNGAGSSTMIFGRPPPEAEAPPEPVSEPAPEPFEEEPVAPAREDRTLRFGLAELEAQHRAKEAADQEAAAAAARRAGPTAHGPQEPSPSIEISEELLSPSTGTPAANSEPARIDLPPEREPEAAPLPLNVEERAPSADDGFRVYPSKPARSYGWLYAVFAIALLGIAGYVAAKQYQKRKAQIPPDVQQRLLAAQTQLRADDPAALQRASTEFDAIASAYPSWREPRAWQAMAIALRLDDARLQIQLLNTQIAELHRRITRLEDEKEPVDWQNRVNAMQDEVDRLKKAAAPLEEQARNLDVELGGALTIASDREAELSPEDQLALARARLLSNAVKGLDPVAALAQYRTRGGTGGWDRIASAEYAVNHSEVSQEELKGELEAMQALRQSDSTFIRAHLLAARLAMKVNDRDAAQSALDTAIALNPDHQVARTLLNNLQRRAE